MDIVNLWQYSINTCLFYICFTCQQSWDLMEMQATSAFSVLEELCVSGSPPTLSEPLARSSVEVLETVPWARFSQFFIAVHSFSMLFRHRFIEFHRSFLIFYRLMATKQRSLGQEDAAGFAWAFATHGARRETFQSLASYAERYRRLKAQLLAGTLDVCGQRRSL